MNAVRICCDTGCNVRMECALFSLALDVNSGKNIGPYDILPTGECHGRYYEKAKK